LPYGTLSGHTGSNDTALKSVWPEGTESIAGYTQNDRIRVLHININLINRKVMFLIKIFTWEQNKSKISFTKWKYISLIESMKCHSNY